MMLIAFLFIGAVAFGSYARSQLVGRKIKNIEYELRMSNIDFDDLKRVKYGSIVTDLDYYRALCNRQVLGDTNDDYELLSRMKNMRYRFDLFTKNLSSYWYCVKTYLFGEN